MLMPWYAIPSVIVKLVGQHLLKLGPRKPTSYQGTARFPTMKLDCKNCVSQTSVRATSTASKSRFIGAHVSAAEGLHNSFKNAQAIGADAFAMFLKNQRRWESPPLSLQAIEKFREHLRQSAIPESKILPHGSYLINLGNPDPEKRTKSYQAFVDDLRRCETLGLTLYNFHPGSTVGKCTTEESIGLIADSINKAHDEVPNVCIVLETMAGQGNTIGNSFEDLRDIISKVIDKGRVGVCMDTCHIFAAGYDIRDKSSYERTMDQFEAVVGFEYLKGVHLNDSKAELGSGKDRHENIGKGKIGIEAFRLIMNDPRFDHVPLVLETPVPNESANSYVYSQEISLLRSLIC